MKEIIIDSMGSIALVKLFFYAPVYLIYYTMKGIRSELLSSIGIHTLLSLIVTSVFAIIMPAFVHNSFWPFIVIVLLSGFAILIYHLVKRLFPY